MSAWQTIATAPKDGTMILVTGCNGFGMVIPAEFVSESVDEDFVGPGWFGCPASALWTRRIANPTHWQPLPEPPCPPSSQP